MTVKIGINGFGRIGRIIMRCLLEGQTRGMEVVHINSRGDSATAAHLFKYDSSFGAYRGEVESEKSALIIDGKSYPYSQHADPETCDWSGVDVLLECTGNLKDRTSNEVHLRRGAAKVLVAYPCKDADVTVVYGVNHDAITKESQIISNASCTTNCLAPPLLVLQEAFGIICGAMTTVHAYTGDQNLLDASHADLRRARAAAMSIIPTSTGAAKNIGLVIPALEGKLNGYAMRVPTPVVSCVDLSINLEKNASVEDINAAMKTASQGKLKGVLAYNEAPLVSVDFTGHSASSIFDATLTQVMGGNLLRLLSWYDNEWGFSCRMLDVAAHIKAVA